MWSSHIALVVYENCIKTETIYREGPKGIRRVNVKDDDIYFKPKILVK